jgi:BirA family transcriptional regulator, biotin operon repressor / biotin---[acetyl-CoA-carboxylase] ligase
MAATPDPLPPEFAAAFARVNFRRLGVPTLFFSTVGSTNDVATALAANGHHEGAVVIADAQTAGRGRRGRSWFSPPGSGLYVSVLLAPAQAVRTPDRATALLTLTVGVALAEAVERITGLAPAIKWPNDLLIGRRKLAGILAEGVVSPVAFAGVQSVVLGYGINVSAAAYPAELSDRVTSLESELGRPIDRADLCAQSLASLASRYDDLLAARFDAILDAWRDRAPGSRGMRVAWETPGGSQSGITAGIDDMGALLVRVGDRTERLVAGEITWA